MQNDRLIDRLCLRADNRCVRALRCRLCFSFLLVIFLFRLYGFFFGFFFFGLGVGNEHLVVCVVGFFLWRKHVGVGGRYLLFGGRGRVCHGDTFLCDGANLNKGGQIAIVYRLADGFPRFFGNGGFFCVGGNANHGIFF